jgi:hypothetical protein
VKVIVPFYAGTLYIDIKIVSLLFYKLEFVFHATEATTESEFTYE